MQKPFLVLASIAGLGAFQTNQGAHALPPIPGKIGKLGDSGKSAEERDRKVMGEVNRLAQEGLGKVPGNFRTDCNNVRTSLGKAKTYYDDITKQVATVSRPSVNEGAQRRWMEFKLAYEQAALQLPACEAWYPIDAGLRRNEPVEDAQLDKLDTAIADFEKGHAPESARLLGAWKDVARKLRQENMDLRGRQAANAARAAAADALAAKNKRLERAETALKALKKANDEGAFPITAALWAEFDAAVTAAAEVRPSARAAFEHAALRFRVADAWAGADTRKRLSELFGAEKDWASGLITTPTVRASFGAEAGHCYLVVGHATDGSEVRSIEIALGKNYMDVQPFRSDASGVYFRGACVTKDTTLDFNIALEAPGTKVNGQWQAFIWKRESFPVHVAAQSVSQIFEDCTPQVVLNTWKHGVPGSLLWSKDGEPLRFGGSDDDGTWFNVYQVPGPEGRRQPDALQSAWPERKAFAPPEFHDRCSSNERSLDPTVQAAITCLNSVAKQFGPKFDAAARRRDQARTLGAIAAADKELDRLKEAASTARRTKCHPLIAKYEKSMTEAIRSLNDWFVSNPELPSGPDIVAYWKQIGEGRRRFVD